MTIKHPNEREMVLRPLVDEVIAARNAGDFQRGIGLCDQLLKMLSPDERTWVAFANAELGYIYYEGLNNPEVAEQYFQRAVSVSPRSEIASLGVFQSRGRQQRWHDALSEVLRFVSIRDSAEYRAIFTDEYVSDFSGDELELAKQIRTALLNKT